VVVLIAIVRGEGGGGGGGGSGLHGGDADLCLISNPITATVSIATANTWVINKELVR